MCSSFPRWASNRLKTTLIFQKKQAHFTLKIISLACDYNKFSELKAKCKRVSKLNYQTHIDTIENQLLHSPRDFWKYFYNLNHHSSIPTRVYYDLSIASNTLEAASPYSDYFASVFKLPNPSSVHNSFFNHHYFHPSCC